MKRFSYIWTMSFFCWCLFSAFAWAGGDGFTQEDRERLIRLEARFDIFMTQTNKRFEAVDKRFEELREDQNRRFEELREDMNKRFEAVDKRFDQLNTFLLIIAGTFTTLVVAVIGLALWDRYTHLRRAVEESVKEVDRVYGVGLFKSLLNAMRTLAEKDERFKEVLKACHLL